MGLNKAGTPAAVALLEIEATRLASQDALRLQGLRLTSIDEFTASLPNTVQARQHLPFMCFLQVTVIDSSNVGSLSADDRGTDRRRGRVKAWAIPREFFSNNGLELVAPGKADLAAGAESRIEASEIYQLHINAVGVAVSVICGPPHYCRHAPEQFGQREDFSALLAKWGIEWCQVKIEGKDQLVARPRRIALERAGGGRQDNLALLRSY